MGQNDFLSISALMNWLEAHPELLVWMGAASLLMFFGSLALVPWLVARIPANYFAHQSRSPTHWKYSRPLVRLLVLIVKNLIGWILLLAGIAMIVLPGQGVLTILMALMLMDYPGKFQLERRVISQPGLLRVVNRLRDKRGKPALIIEKSQD